MKMWLEIINSFGRKSIKTENFKEGDVIVIGGSMTYKEFSETFDRNNGIIDESYDQNGYKKSLYRKIVAIVSVKKDNRGHTYYHYEEGKMLDFAFHDEVCLATEREQFLYHVIGTDVLVQQDEI
jgi:hypothetical protein